MHPLQLGQGQALDVLAACALVYESQVTMQSPTPSICSLNVPLPDLAFSFARVPYCPRAVHASTFSHEPKTCKGVCRICGEGHKFRPLEH